MHYLDESHILLFLLQLLVLLGAARTLGAICERFDIPALAGEIFAGVLLGPTLLGRASPDFQAWLFPQDPIQSTMLETVSWLGVFFLLLSSGFHVDVRRALKQGKEATSVGIVGVVVPILVGIPAFWALDESYWGENATQLSFVLFLSVAGSITAISVVARAIDDAGLTGHREGTLALSACAVNDIFGWLLFTVVLSIASAESLDVAGVAMTFGAILAFIAAVILIGSRVMGIAAGWVLDTSLPQPAALMTLVVTAGLLCGAITHALGIHAILGFFLAGTMAGSAPNIPQSLRDSLSETLHAVFVPVFFATLGIQLDFLDGIDFAITALFTAVAVGGKFFGAWIGARLSGVERPTSLLVAAIFVPGGAMEIVIGTLAMELRLISSEVFVAIVFAALVSSIVAGPLIVWRTPRRLRTPPDVDRDASPQT